MPIGIASADAISEDCDVGFLPAIAVVSVVVGVSDVDLFAASSLGSGEVGGLVSTIVGPRYET